MVINVSVQYNGGSFPEVILLTLCDYVGEPFKFHIEFSSLQPMFPPKPFDCSGGLAAFRFFLSRSQQETIQGHEIRLDRCCHGYRAGKRARQACA